MCRKIKDSHLVISREINTAAAAVGVFFHLPSRRLWPQESGLAGLCRGIFRRVKLPKLKSGGLAGRRVRYRYMSVLSGRDGHDEVCQARLGFTIQRHNAIVHALEDALKTVSGTRVEVEPTSLGETMERNDLRVWGSIGLCSRTSEHDVKVYSLFGSHVPSSLRSRHHPQSNSNTPKFDRVLGASNQYLIRIAKQAQDKAPEGVGDFGALVFSSGGLVEAGTQRQLDRWKLAVGTPMWGWTMRRISLGLIRARGRTWTVRRV